jgi:23S rRNA (adenine2503-C2)-methyltransferase
MIADVYGLDRPALTAWLISLGLPSYTGSQVFQWVHQKNATDWQALSNVSIKAKNILKEHVHLHSHPLTIVRTHTASDDVVKWVLSVGNSDACIETVYIPEAKRATLCVSSQVGCALACRFCATGKQGFLRHLTTSDIIAQYRLASQWASVVHAHPITNVVFMGMGEPLLNTDAVITAIRILTDSLGYALAPHRVTVSTAGIIPGIQALKAAQTGASLAVSLHAPTQALRATIMPIAKKYPLSDLIPVCQNYFEKQRTVMFEYVLLKGVNDSLEHAKELTKLLNFPCKINLIPFNTFDGASDTASSQAAPFQHYLQKKGFIATLRKTRGQEQSAACGQLTGVVPKRIRVKSVCDA